MTQPETSYYEIALTNRQIVSVFVVLLACVVVAFLAGVWVGRGGGEPPLETAEAEVVPGGDGERPLEQLQIFSGDGEMPPDEGADTAAPPADRATGGRPGGAADPAPRDTRPPARPEAPPATVAERRAPPAVEPEEPEPAPAAEPPRPAPEAEAPAGSTAEAPAAAAVTGLVVQVFSSKDLQQAERVLDRLRAAGYPAVLAPVDVRGESMYRVRVGPYAERAEAQEVADRVRRDFRLETWITE